MNDNLYAIEKTAAFELSRLQQQTELSRQLTEARAILKQSRKTERRDQPQSVLGRLLRLASL